MEMFILSVVLGCYSVIVVNVAHLGCCGQLVIL